MHVTDEFLRIESLVKSFNGNLVVKGANLSFNRGEFISLLGPSGCGKTTILRMIAGFERPTSGNILVEGHDITNLPPNQRKIGMVFQAYALFPNMNVEDNVGFGLKIAGMSKDERGARVEEMLKLIGLPGYGKRYPFEMSGGQQQRVALARALAPKPRMLLLDEPLSALDAKIRVSLRQEIRAIQRDLGITTIFVTHDQEEALSISDRIVVMNAGNIEQVGAPFEVYNYPRTRFVASFVGTLNILSGKIVDASNGRIAIDGQEIRAVRGVTDAKAGDRRSVALRPEAIVLNGAGGGRNEIRGTITDVNFLGAVVRIRVRIAESSIELDTFNSATTPPPKTGEQVTVSFAPEDVLMLEAAPA
jgi:putative spermidine/putrescine transport system ATP-binding protein